MNQSKLQRVLLGLFLLPLCASANPTGGSVAGGSASIAGEGTGAVTIHQLSNTAIINWQTFSIGSGESTTFLQPSAQSAVLNRVLGGETSIIDGTLTANGQVYLVNGNGVIVGPGGVITANAFTASTRDISNSDFLAGNLHFVGSGDAGVQNMGTISALGGDVVLIGKTVDNAGTISAPNGTAGLVAGDDVLLAQKNADGSTIKVSATVSPSSASGQVGVNNSGAITAAAAELKAANGNIYALAVQNQGTIRATTVKKQGGHIWLMADSGAVVNSGTLDASASVAGGQGGTIETSGDSVSVSGTVTAGKGGAWLIDPLGDITISSGVASANNFNVTTLDSSLSGGTSTTIDAVGGTTDTGNIDVNNAVSWTGDASLTLNAQKNINVNAGITSSGDGAVNLNSDSTGTGVGTVTFNNGAQVSTSGAVNIFYNPTNPGGTTPGTINATEYKTPTDYSGDVAGGATLTAYMLVNNVDDLQNVQNNLGANYAQNTNINASATGTWNPTTTGTVTTYAGFNPLGSGATPFTGTYNGNNFTITGLTINQPSGFYTGLFGYVANNNIIDEPGTIENVNLISANVTGLINVGALVGESDGIEENCSATGTVTAGEQSLNVGGLVGVIGSDDGISLLENSHANVSVIVTGDGATSVGGLVGDNGNGSVENCYATGAVDLESTAGSEEVGGLVGSNDSTITQSYATGTVTGGSYTEWVGGLVGLNDGPVTYSYATGSVSGGAQVGGFAGANEGGSITDCYATGNVTGSNSPVDAGGFVGENDGTIEACYSLGTVQGSSGAVDDYVGAFAGDNPGAISDSFWDTTTSYLAASTGGVGAGNTTGLTAATTLQLMSPAFITANSAPGSWNFTAGTGVWGIDGYMNNGSGKDVLVNDGLPYFQWQYPTVAVTAANQSVVYSGSVPTLPNATDYTVTGNPAFLLNTPSITLTGNAVNGGSTDAITVNAVPVVGDVVDLINGSLTITAAPLTVTANDGSITYQGYGFTGGEGVTYSGLLAGQSPSVLGGTLTYTGSAEGASNVGTYTLTPGGLASSNYAITFVSGSLTINPAPLTVTANSVTQTYNGQPFTGAGVTYVGLKGTDTVGSVLTGNLSLGGNAIGAVNAGSYTIIPSGLSLIGPTPNYTLSYANGALTINPAVLTVTVKSGSSIYGADVAALDPVPGLSISGLVGADTAASIGYSSLITGTLGGITDTTNAGKYDLTIGGSLDDPNYVLKTGSTSPVGKTTTWTVTPDVLTISGLTGTSIYGQTPATPSEPYTLTSSNGVTNQATLLSLLSTAPMTTPYTFSITDTTNAGKYNTDQITSTPTLANGVDASDYTLKTVTQGVWTVTPDLITIAGLTNGSSTYGFATGFDSSDYFTISDEDNTSGIASFVQNPKATLSASATSNVGTYNVPVSGSLAAGVSSADYKIVFTPGEWMITPQAVEITIDGGESVYGGKPTTPTLSATGVVNGKDVALTSRLLKGYSTDLISTIGATGSAGAGQYTIDLAGTPTGNYVAANPGATATWTVEPATISAINVVRTAKSTFGTNPVNSVLKVTGLVNGDTSGVLGYTLVGTGGQLTAYTDASTTPYAFTIEGGLTDSNYVLKAGLSSPINIVGQLTIDPAALTIGALSGSSLVGYDPIYGNSAGDFGYSVTGLVNGDTINSTGILAGFSENPVITNVTPAGKYTIAVTAPLVLNDTNYTVKVVKGQWTVEQ